ncbi:MAG: glycosyltransferase family 2 protein [Phycisphaerae bacterium]|nr:glycosyltransferase family 2 protein [Phycisphaerae bacterium]
MTSHPDAPEISVLAPVYNEADCIERVVRYWNDVLDQWPRSSEIVLGNDGSTDGTGEILERLSGEMPRLRVNTRHKNGGYGAALASAIAGSRGNLVVTLDSDGQFDLADARGLIERLETEDLDAVTGRRASKRDSFMRVLADRTLNRIVRLMFGVTLRDTNCALKVIRGDLARALTIEARGFPTPTEIVLKLSAQGARLGEETVSHADRVAGASKLKVWRTGLDMWRFLWYLRRKIKLYRRGVLQRL